MIGLSPVGNYSCMNRFLLCLLPLFTGCATNLSSLQTAKTLNPGQIRLTGGFGVHIPAGQVLRSASEGIKLSAKVELGHARTSLSGDGVLMLAERADERVGAGRELELGPALSARIAARAGGRAWRLSHRVRDCLLTIHADAAPPRSVGAVLRKEGGRNEPGRNDASITAGAEGACRRRVGPVRRRFRPVTMKPCHRTKPAFRA